MGKPMAQEHLMAQFYTNTDGEMIAATKVFDCPYFAVRNTDSMRFLPCFSTNHKVPCTCNDGKRAVFLTPKFARQWLISRMLAYKEINMGDKSKITNKDIANMGYEFVKVYKN